MEKGTDAFKHVFTYKKNLAAVASHSAGLLDWIESAPEDDRFKIEESGENTGNLLIQPPSGSAFYYYGAPPSVRMEYGVIDGLDLSGGGMTCLVGMGMGYTTRAILEKMAPGHHVMVLEPNPWILKAALQRVDLSEWVKGGPLHLVRPLRRDIEDVFLNLISDGTLHGNIRVIADPRAAAISNDYQAWSKEIEDAYQQAMMLIDNVRLVAKKSIENEIGNTISVSLTAGVESLKPLIQGKPVLIIGAGPSLDQSIEKIRRAKEKMFLFAFSATLRNLLSKGVMPDFVLSSDNNVESLVMLKYTRHAHRIPLIFASSCHPEFLRNYLGPRFTVPQHALYPMPPSHKKHSISLGTGTSVAVFAYNLAVYLSADPIVLTGLDLAVDKATHAGGHRYRCELDPHDSRLIDAPGIHGKTVRTLPYLNDIRKQLEWAVGSSKREAVNATISGAHIENTVERDLDAVTKGLVPLDKKPETIPVSFHEDTLGRLPLTETEELLSRIQRVREICTAGIRSLELFSKHRKKGRDDPALAEEINRTGKELQELLVRSPLLNRYFSSIWLKLKQETRKTLSIPDRAKRLNLETAKNLEALRSIDREAETFIKELFSQHRDMSDFVRLGEGGVSDGKEGDRLERLRVLIKAGLYDQAGRELERVNGKTAENRLIEALFKFRTGLLSEAESLIREDTGDPVTGEEVRDLLHDIDQEKESLLREAGEVESSGSFIDVSLMEKELARSLPDHPGADGLRSRLRKRLESESY